MLTKKQFTKKLGKNIKRAREKKGISQEELADRADLYRTYVGHLENARYSPSAYVLHKVAEALGISYQNLLDF